MRDVRIVGLVHLDARLEHRHVGDGQERGRVLVQRSLNGGLALFHDQSRDLAAHRRNDQQPGRSTIWLHPSIPLRFVFDGPEPPELSEDAGSPAFKNRLNTALTFETLVEGSANRMAPR